MAQKSNPLKPSTSAPILPLIRPFQAFAHQESSGGIVLLLCTVIALLWVNSPWHDSYHALWHTHFSIGIANQIFDRDLHFWVNDGLMAIFFFVVGLEIKRELLVGELATPRQAMLPLFGALGGVMVPAAIYASLNYGGPGAAGWGVPMATDIAFVIGVMALLGDRVPIGLKVFLTALAIVDDIVAVLVIAIFYTAEISWSALGLAAAGLLVLYLGNRAGVRHPLPYTLVGIAVWLAVLSSGVHATIAGVLVAFTIPARSLLDAPGFLRHSRSILDHFEHHASQHEGVMRDAEQQMAIEALEDSCEKAQPPLYRLEQALHPWVSFLIMPLFALANAGVALGGDLGRLLADPITLGVILGLFLGKPIGIFSLSWLAIRFRLADLPHGVRWSHTLGAGVLGGIGFTMSLFIAALAFPSQELLDTAKLGILLGSLMAAIAGSAILLRQRA
jgi:NhaA family Na+:H+ antiporter